MRVNHHTNYNWLDQFAADHCLCQIVFSLGGNGALHLSRTADLLLGSLTRPEKSLAAVTDYNGGISQIQNLHGFLDR